MQAPSKTVRWSARSGLILGPLAWGLNQQFTSTFIYAKCEAARLPLVLTSGILCACIAIAGLLLSWSARRSAADESTTFFTATLGVLSAAMFLLVIVSGTLAGFLLPGCYR
ncbi:MAG: hypothetical protein ACJ8R9_35090 [Steroidobacteraceae bacterium]